MDHSLGLGVDDLGDVLEETLSSSTKWYKIGLQLKVPVAKLDGIRKEFTDQEDCLCEMLKEWLKGAAGTEPSWRVLVETLRSQTVRETQLADQLEAKHYLVQCERSYQGKCVVCMPNHCTVGFMWLQLSLSFVLNLYRELLYCFKQLFCNPIEDKN